MKEEYINLVNLLLTWNKHYHILNTPLVEDSEYDLNYQRLVRIEKLHPEYIVQHSPTQTVGSVGDTKFSGIVHPVKMLSLDNSFSNEDTIEFFERIIKTLGCKTLEVSYEPKYDGLAITLMYINGKLTYASTRGDGNVGEDVTVQINAIDSIPKVIPCKLERLEIRGEVFMSKKAFVEYNKLAIENGQRPFSNTRNAAAGTMRLLDLNIVKKRNLTFIPYGLGIQSPKFPRYKLHSGNLGWFKKLGFLSGPECGTFVFSEKEIVNSYNHMETLRKSLPVDIDGIVYKVNLMRQQRLLGDGTRTPKWAIARKFPSEKMTTVIKGVNWQVGRTGQITPVAKLEPVSIGGVTVSSCTLHNYDEIKRLGVCVGSTVVLERAGDVIPKVTGVIDSNNPTTTILEPTVCPACKSPVYNDSMAVGIFCTNGIFCPAQKLERLIHFVSKKAMDIDTLGPKLLEQLYESGVVTVLSDIYKLQFSHIANIQGYGSISAEKLMGAIERSKRTTLRRFIYALGISGVGEGTSKQLVKRYSTLGEIVSATEKDLMSIPDIGNTTASSVVQFFKDERNINVINELLHRGVIPITEINTQSTLNSTIWVITGTLSKPRVEFIKLLEDNGATISGDISSKTTHVLLGVNPSVKKLKLINTLSLITVSENDLLTNNFNIISSE